MIYFYKGSEMKVQNFTKSLLPCSTLLFLFGVMPFLLMAAIGMTPSYADQDGDTYDPPLDCNDANGNIYPGAAETCNGFDDDCDGSLDEGCSTDCTDPDLKGNLKRVTDDSSTSKEVSIAWTGSSFGISWQDVGDDGMAPTAEIFGLHRSESPNSLFKRSSISWSTMRVCCAVAPVRRRRRATGRLRSGGISIRKPLGPNLMRREAPMQIAMWDVLMRIT